MYHPYNHLLSTCLPYASYSASDHVISNRMTSRQDSYCLYREEAEGQKDSVTCTGYTVAAELRVKLHSFIHSFKNTEPYYAQGTLHGIADPKVNKV